MALGCSSVTGPFADVTTTISVSPTALAPGEFVSIQMVATNSSADSIDTNHSCAPGLGFEAIMPDRARRDPMGEAGWNCPGRDSQVLEPFETDTVSYRWAVPAQRGVYTVRAGARSATGLVAHSAPASFEVR
jgi:hypothetical protein